MPPADAVGLYFPKHYYPRENPFSADNDPRAVSRGLCVANHLLQQLGHATRLVRGDQPVPRDLSRLVIAGAHLDADEARAIDDWVRSTGATNTMPCSARNRRTTAAFDPLN